MSEIVNESFAELFEESLQTVEMKPGSIVTGTVVEIDNEWVVVHAGLKSEGVIPRSQFLTEAGEFNLNVGDQVQVARVVAGDDQAIHFAAWAIRDAGDSDRIAGHLRE